MAKFRFQDLEIWQMAITLGERLFDIADELERKHLYRFADQIRGSGMSMSNNIAEGSACESIREFGRFLGYARRSVFENANIAIVVADGRRTKKEKNKKQTEMKQKSEKENRRVGSGRHSENPRP